MSQKPPVSTKITSAAPEIVYDEDKPTPTVTLELDGGDTFEAVFATDDAASAFLQNLVSPTRRFISVQNEDGKRKLFGVDFIKSAEVTQMANPPEKTERTVVVGETVAFTGSNLTSARRGDDNTMSVTFADGRQFEYYGVDNDTFGKFINDKNAARYFDRSIRGKFTEKPLP